MRLPLFVTCPVDLVRPSIAFASLRLLERASCKLFARPGRTGCGQPAWTAGNRGIAVDLARQAIVRGKVREYVVISSGSCADRIRNVHRDRLAAEPARAAALVSRSCEGSCFCSEVPRPESIPGESCGSVTCNESFQGTRATRAGWPMTAGASLFSLRCRGGATGAICRRRAGHFTNFMPQERESEHGICT